MHELAIASSILRLARQHVPPGAVLRSVKIRAGPLRGIEPQAMQAAWEASITGSDFKSVSLRLEIPPWRLRCPECEATFEASNAFQPCACGCTEAYAVGGDELSLVSIEVDDPVATREQVA